MAYYVKSIVPIIESKYNSFTHVEKNIADFFLNNQKKMDFSAQNVAQEIFVSEASLSRFAKKCGFHGYREFIYQYEETFVEKSEVVANSTRMVLNTYQELLNKTYSLMDEAQIARIVKYLYDAERVVACGKGSSGLAASEMESRFMRIGVDIDSLRDTDRMRMQAVFQNKRSLVCGFTISGETEEVLYLLKEAHKRGAKTIIFTANDKESYSDFCTEVVLVASLKHLDHGNVISPQFPILVMMDIIYNNYVSHDKYGNAELYDDTLRALKSGNTHITS
ncbi:MAG: MurR/RpiR family transcriptional regulator [Clostridiales bacterium]|nr:MurR/RpiR family transcriptional regulator [Roseburia sp.]MDD7637000.1 MurR/RpiR family transcriptional regulator [Clostridiales bacterium]MDY4112571.1 MurR/RpiR family transcriptional regulator [Roseburia sp.]